MKSVNKALRQAYKSALSTLTYNGGTVPVYYLAAPESETGQYYITLNQPANVDTSTKSTSDTRTSIQVQIHTWAHGANDGEVADAIANSVFSLVYSTPTTVLDLSSYDLQMVSTRLDNDLVNEISGIGQRVFVTRILTFAHLIHHNPS